MSGRTDAAIRADRRRVQRAALRAGVWVAAASAVVVTLLSVVTIAALSASSRPEHPPEGPGPGGGRPPGRVIELGTAIPIAVAVGLLGIIALGATSWYLARQAAQPLAAALEVQRSFVADASHELRTPLTTLTSRIQLAEHRAARGGDVGGALADLRRDAAVMDAVLTDLLVTAESAGTTGADAHAAASVGAAAREAASVLAPRAAEADVSVAVEVADGLVVAADAVALQRALTALLDNALRFAPRGSTVEVSAVVVGRRVDIRVVDHGPGIRGIDPEHVFDRFARAEGAGDSSGRRGFGLGLALVRDLAHRFGGTVAVEETSASGTTFLLSLPAATATDARKG
ncbi:MULTISPECIES: sensor histidine kinase KdpD [Microbacterium]|uniref:sensor histidine kinase n=1 Tax=Microbacterium TaxID=33882 RepID=UPI000CFA9732|nr:MULTISPECIES: HAMP domain-containing sensor histidine kinase [unclassified Microbacterium]PRB10585.1 two-component sensor histidine kinase [Microbacterium sp. MYb72]